MRLCLTDFRSPARWSKFQRARKAERSIISPLWSSDPFGITPTETLVQIQPGVWSNRGVAVGDPTSFNPDLARWIELADGWLRNPAGKKIALWIGTDGQRVDALDLSREDVRRAWTDRLANHFNFADGLHLDYFCSLAWIDNTFPPTFWTTWFDGWKDITERLRAHRPDWCLIGREWHLTPITDHVDGLFKEVDPWNFGLQLPDHRHEMEVHGRPQDWVMELREPERYPAEVVKMLEGFIEENGCYGSFGMDDRARSA